MKNSNLGWADVRHGDIVRIMSVACEEGSDPSVNCLGLLDMPPEVSRTSCSGQLALIVKGTAGMEDPTGHFRGLHFIFLDHNGGMAHSCLGIVFEKITRLSPGIMMKARKVLDYLGYLALSGAEGQGKE